MVDTVKPNVCLDSHLSTDAGGQLQLEKWSVPRLVADLRAESAGDGSLASTIALPGKLLIQAELGWTSDAPNDVMVLIRVIRSWRGWLTSNPNAIQFRDRWTWAIDRTPSIPVTTGIYNSQCGSAVDTGTNSVSEPNPGKQWMWTPTTMSDEWVGPLAPGQRIEVHYRTYVWTPPPFSNNANKNSPVHQAAARFSRVQLQAFPTQDSSLVSG